MREIPEGKLLKDARRVLENPFYIPDLEPMEVYSRLQDDHDGEFDGFLEVIIGPDGDAWVKTQHTESRTLRFRNFMGGGQSLRVQNALMILALAIKLDNEERPQQIPNPPVD